MDGGEWLTYQAETRAAPVVRENTLNGYRVAIRVHLIPGVGAHRLDKLEPEHLEKLYARMISAGSSPGTAYQAHRTIRTALGEAERRGRIHRNPAKLAKAPRLSDHEIEPYTVAEVRALLEAASRERKQARWAIALSLGLRQGEVLGLRWSDVDVESGTLRVGAADLQARVRRQVREAGRLLPGTAAGAERDGGHEVPGWPATNRAAARPARTDVGAPAGAGPGA